MLRGHGVQQKELLLHQDHTLLLTAGAAWHCRLLREIFTGQEPQDTFHILWRAKWQKTLKVGMITILLHCRIGLGLANESQVNRQCWSQKFLTFCFLPHSGYLTACTNSQIVLHVMWHQHGSWAVWYSLTGQGIFHKDHSKQLSPVNDLVTLNEQMIWTLLMTYAFMQRQHFYYRYFDK